MTKIPLYQVDAFTDKVFTGNPAGVCLLESEMPAGRMQALAMEMNLSETAFLLPENDGYRLRWFTPAVEVDLCGHATLASAHILWEVGLLKPEQQARFYTNSGLLTARKNGEWIELNFPTTPPQPAEAPEGLLESLGVKPIYVGKSCFDFLLEVSSEAEVRAVCPDFVALKLVEARGVIVTARGSSSGHDFISRFFGPRAGVNEDPVTGSAHCCLTPYWAEKLGKANLVAYQASSRGGELRVRLEGERVTLAGQAVTFFSAQIGRMPWEGI